MPAPLRSLAGTLVLAAALGGPAARAGSQAAPPCAPPYAPVAVDPGGGAPGWPGGAAPLEPVVVDGTIDTDGDGRPDLVETVRVDDPTIEPPFTMTVRITRGDGVIELTGLYATASATDVGDLDGDGLGDAALSLQSLDTRTGTDRVGLLAPGTAPGTYPAWDRLIDVGFPASGIARAGEGRLVVTHVNSYGTEARVRVVDGVALAAVGPDGDTITPLVDVPGHLAGWARFAVARPALVVLDAHESPDIGATVIEGAMATSFTLAGPLVADDSQLILAAVDAPGGRLLELTALAGDTVEVRALWSLDDPCTALVLAGPPVAPPAEPVAAEAAFTG